MTENSGETVLNNATLQTPTVKVKQEKIDLEVENRLKCLKVVIKPEPEADHSADEDSDSEESSDNSEPEEDEKKDIAPVKTSNEILAELFGVFNAAPPEVLLNDKNLLKKNAYTKKVKKEKKKKHKRVKSNGECSQEDALENDGKPKHKKKKKHKHKQKSAKEKDKHKHRDVDKGKDKDRVKSKEQTQSQSHREEKSKERESHKGKTKNESERLEEDLKKDNKDCKEMMTRDRKRHHTSVDDSKHAEHETTEPPASKSSRVIINDKERERDRAHNSFYNGFHERDEVRKESTNERERHRSTTKSNKHENSNRRDDQISDISLSDEETFLRERDSKGRRAKRSNEREATSRVHNSFYGSSSNHRRRTTGEDRSSDLGRHSRRQRSSRSRSRSRTPIDKKRLFEIARKNAITMVKHGKIPDSVKLSKEARDKLLMNWRYGGRSVDDLTEFCRKIANGESAPELSSDDGDSDVDKNGNAKAFNHPFQLKEREPIVMHIRNATTLVPSRKQDDATKAITMQFPVSSGQQHRMSEVWVPVEKKDPLVPLPTLPPAKQSTNIFKDTTLPKNVFEKPIPLAEQQEPAFKPVGSVSNTTNNSLPPQPPPQPTQPPQPVPSPLATSTTPMNEVILNNNIQPASQKPTLTPTPAITTDTFVPEVPIPSTAPDMPSSNDVLFPTVKAPTVDVSSIITKRLNAIRRLQENPTDPDALKLMYNAQRDMSSWASSKHIPGQFTGSTGAYVMKAHELNSGPQLWVRRDQLTSTKPVTGGMGMALLQKMGWKPGEGLGPSKNGSLQPLLLDVKLDKRGLVSSEDNCQKQKQQQRQLLLQQQQQQHQQHHHQQQQQQQQTQQTQQLQQQQQQQHHHHQQTPQPPSIRNKLRSNTIPAPVNIHDKHPVCVLNELTSKNRWTPPQYTLLHEHGPSHGRYFLFSVEINGNIYTPQQPSNTKKEAKFMAAKTCLQTLGILPPNS